MSAHPQEPHEMIRKGCGAKCSCGCWSCRTNEVNEAAIMKTLSQQFGLHVESSK